jgi:flagellar protein FlaG
MIEDIVQRDGIRAGLPEIGPDNSRQMSSKEETPSPEPMSLKTLQSTVAKVQESLGKLDSSLKIEVDADSHQVVVKVLNDQSGEIIRQIPAEEMIEIAKRLDASQALLLTKRT